MLKLAKTLFVLIFMITAVSSILTPEEVEAYTIDIVMDGNYLYTDVPPVMIQDRVLVPMRAIFEAAGLYVEWDNYYQMIYATDGSNELVMFLGNYEAYFNGEPFYLSVPPIIINDRTMVPLRFVGEMLGYYVEWDQYTQTAYLSSQ